MKEKKKKKTINRNENIGERGESGKVNSVDIFIIQLERFNTLTTRLKIFRFASI